MGVFCTHIRFPQRLWRLAEFQHVQGVQLFFALSGFLITSRLLQEHDDTGTIVWRNFYVRRVFRILPPALLTLAVLALLGPVLHVFPIKWREVVASVFFYRNYLIHAAWYTGHFWSLGVEEHFYILWPVVLGLVGIASGARTALILAGVFVLWRHTGMHFDSVLPVLSNARRTDYRIPGLFLGCAAAFLWRNDRARGELIKVARSWWALPLMAAVMVISRYSLRHPDIRPWSDDGIDLLMPLLLIVTVADPRGVVSRVLETQPLQWIGRLSYSLYLWQQIFFPLPYAPKSIVQEFPFNVGAAFVAALLSYHLVERPSIAFGRRLVVSPVKKPVAAVENRALEYPSGLR